MPDGEEAQVAFIPAKAVMARQPFQTTTVDYTFSNYLDFSIASKSPEYRTTLSLDSLKVL
jgi:hypothetical protein